MKKIIVLVFLIFGSFNICFSQSGWYQLQSGTTYSFKDVYFINEQTGWAVSDSGRVFMTTTGGLSWSMQQIGSPDLYTINFANSSTGYIGGGLCLMQFTGVSYLYKTTNQGLNWFFTSSGYGGDYIYWISSIAVINPETVFTSSCGQYSLGGSVGNVAKSTNGGVNFSTGYGVGQHKSVSFINEQTGWTLANYADDIGKHYCYILKTTNSGNNWSVQLKDSVRIINFTKIKFFDGNTGYAIGGGNSPNRTLFFKTTNGGIIWDTLVTPNSSKYLSMSFLNPNTGWICGSPYGDTSAIAKTTNGGQTWINQRKNYNDYLTSIFMLNENVGYAVGYGGEVLKTTTGGFADTLTPKYFPMQTGNFYIYHSWDYYNLEGTYFKARITKDTIAFGHKYFYCQNFPGIQTGWVRYDSISGLLLQLYPGNGCGNSINDKIIDSLSAKINDQLNYCPYYYTITRTCSDTSNITLFTNYTTKRKSFMHDGLIVSEVFYAMNIGLVHSGSGEPPPISSFVDLNGCLINGLVYGDTTIPTGNYTVSGSVLYSDNNLPATDGYVKAFKLDKSTGNIIILDSAIIQSNGSYILSHVPQDSLDIGVYPNSTTNNDWVITYYPSTIYWQNATILYPTGNMTNVNVGAIRMKSVTANNSVSGKVMRLTNNPVGNLKDAVLYAKKSDTIYRCTVTEINGVYHLTSLPRGNLKIFVNRLGFTSDSINLNVTFTSNIDSINFYLYSVLAGIKQIGSIVPSEYKLFQNYPNPFNPATIIRFSIPSNVKGEMSNVKLVVYDILGKEITTLVNEKLSSGEYESTFNGSSLSSGIYFYTLTSGNFKATKRFVIVK